MNFFNNQIIKNDMQARLFAADEQKIERYEDHQAAIQARLHDLIQDAIDEKENPKALIEGYLGEAFFGGDTIDEIVNFLCNTHFMIHAFGILKDNWNHFDESVQGNSLVYSTGEIGERRASEIYMESTLRSYLESLSQVYNDKNY